MKQVNKMKCFICLNNSSKLADEKNDTFCKSFCTLLNLFQPNYLEELKLMEYCTSCKTDFEELEASYLIFNRIKNKFENNLLFNHIPIEELAKNPTRKNETDFTLRYKIIKELRLRKLFEQKRISKQHMSIANTEDPVLPQDNVIESLAGFVSKQVAMKTKMPLRNVRILPSDPSSSLPKKVNLSEEELKAQCLKQSFVSLKRLEFKLIDKSNVEIKNHNLAIEPKGLKAFISSNELNASDENFDETSFSPEPIDLPDENEDSLDETNKTIKSKASELKKGQNKVNPFKVKVLIDGVENVLQVQNVSFENSTDDASDIQILNTSGNYSPTKGENANVGIESPDDSTKKRKRKKSSPSLKRKYSKKGQTNESKEKDKKSSSISQKEPEGPRQCEECGKILKTRAIFNLHMKRHKGEFKTGERFMCDKCGKSYSKKIELKYHIKRFHTDDPESNYLTCEECGKKMDDWRMKLHMKFHRNMKNNTCDVCNRGFLSSNALQKHKIVHNFPEGVKPFPCDLCESRFLSESNLQYHKKTRHIEKEKYQFKCQLCSFEHYRKDRLRDHMLRHHTLESDRPFMCDFEGGCGKGFIQKSDYDIHLRKHRNERIFQCTHCDKTFITRNTLNEHLKKMKTDYPCSCHICGKEYLSKRKLDIHINAHKRAERKGITVTEKTPVKKREKRKGKKVEQEEGEEIIVEEVDFSQLFEITVQN